MAKAGVARGAAGLMRTKVYNNCGHLLLTHFMSQGNRHKLNTSNMSEQSQAEVKTSHGTWLLSHATYCRRRLTVVS
jgi:hypothetical protein